MFQQVVEYLEAKPVPPGGNMRRADEARAGHQFDDAGLAHVNEALADDIADLAAGAGDRTPVEVVVSQDEINTPLNQGRHRRQG